MAEPFAIPDDLAARWRPLSVAEQATADVLLGDASAYIRVEVSDVDERIAAVPQCLDPAVPRMIVCAMVKRAMLAPVDQGAVSAEQQTAGPFSQSLTFSNPNGDLYLTSRERKMLMASGQQAFTVSMSPESPISTHALSCSLRFGALQCSCGVDIAGAPIFGGGL